MTIILGIGVFSSLALLAYAIVSTYGEELKAVGMLIGMLVAIVIAGLFISSVSLPLWAVILTVALAVLFIANQRA